jgi:hypothetical protein
MTTNLPALSARARKALDALADGGQFRHGLERNSYTGREQFQYRLQKSGSTVRGIGMAAFYELKNAGMIAYASSTSVATYYKLAVA